MGKAIDVTSYELVAEARGQNVIYFEEFGSYQGEWILVSCKDDHYYIYVDCYGSCSGCDYLLDTFQDDVVRYADDDDVQKFIKYFPAFIDFSKEQMLSLLAKDELHTIFPLNIRTGWSDIPYTEVVEKIVGLLRDRVSDS